MKSDTTSSATYYQVLHRRLLGLMMMFLLLLVSQITTTTAFHIGRSVTAANTVRTTTCSFTQLRVARDEAGTIANTTATADKYVLVTGGNKGIGKAICQRLLEEYSDVKVLLGSREEERGQAAAIDLKSRIMNTNCHDRLFVVPLDTASDESVQRAATIIQQQYTDTLYGIVNNAGIMVRSNYETSNQVNYFGPRRVVDAFLDLLKQYNKNQSSSSGEEETGGANRARIVNIASASGPIFISGCSDDKLRQKLSKPWTIEGGIEELDDIARAGCGGGDAYGFSKALVSAYTWLLAKQHPDLIINAVTPGYIDTDMTRGMGASNPPSKGAVPPVWLLMDEQLEHVPTGRYYGSDCQRSPLDVYRGPGDPVYEGPDGPK